MLCSPEHVRRCWELAEGQCQCERVGHGHSARCPGRLTVELYGNSLEGGWLALDWRPRGAGGGVPETCEALCWTCADSILSQPHVEPPAHRH